MVTATDLQAFQADLVGPESAWPFGSVLPKGDSDAITEGLAEFCKLHAAGMVAVDDRYTLLVYPSNAEEWRYLDASTVSLPNTALRFRILPPIGELDFQRRAQPVGASLTVGHAETTHDERDLLGLNDSQLIPRGLDRPVFICWPEDQPDELQLLVYHFQSAKCKVYTASTAGAWNFFRDKYSKSPSTIICHPTTPVGEMTKLHRLLAKDGNTKVFAISRRAWDQKSPETSAKAIFQWEHLFPHGKVIFITDDIFVYHPDQAADILDQFLKANATKPIGGEHDRIVARPGIKAFLRTLTLQHTADRGREDPRWMRLYSKICSLCPTDVEDSTNPSRLLPSSNLISLPPEELPSFEGLWERDEARATEMLVNWFAGWSMANLQSFRRFFVCYEPRGGEMVVDEHGRSVYRVPLDPHGWAERYGNIGVAKPEELLKRGKGKK
ncbi:hypothetical protein B0A50_06898 [Salinomyces thailandicus]|uniref:Uncharacterized protein n=1 Tax=Salinomyces thailandicus TaxID=706561 RepID=A0A4U0TPU8_9PEZI|nr:hypothetical protein B0A50_06898 [Salinomyces thailandica]